MIHLRSIERPKQPKGSGFPWSVACIASLDRHEIDSEVLFLVGENGSGKSTLDELSHGENFLAAPERYWRHV